MTDWLGKLEAFHKMARRNNELEGAVGYPETPGERMARVLRELSEKLEACTNITGIVPNLSDDAKELLKAEGK